ncbi:hypothetical protein BJF80_14175 [Serinicoccus sp. CUA-874]|uniref:tyrosine-type recombinase/integrase n=1 Tax=Serinicoccus sp. CUA-874 TaxID=1517939 RepID=UPI0009659CD1|nr:hypothetical protein BJF80_14175 [Serinicoccus sp. CUA-874]
MIPTAEDVGLLLDSADQKKRKSTRVGFQAYVALCAFAGLRKGEALGVQVADIDFLRRQLKVTRQIQRAKPEDIEAGKNIVEATGGTKVMIRPPKYGSERTIYLCDELIEILSQHIANHTPDGSSDRWLFADDEGRLWHDNSVHWRWRGTRDAAGLRTRLHDLRHFFASGLIAEGCDVVTVSQALGQASTATTHKTTCICGRRPRTRPVPPPPRWPSRRSPRVPPCTHRAQKGRTTPALTNSTNMRRTHRGQAQWSGVAL